MRSSPSSPDNSVRPAIEPDSAASVSIRFGDVGSLTVHLGHGDRFYAEVVQPRLRALSADRLFIVTDDGVARAHHAKLEALRSIGPSHVICVPGGEAAKSFASLGRVAEEVLAHGGTKQSVIVALGGGSVINVAGLVAGLLYRGIRVVYLPTTLLAQHDVIPSRKTAINLCDRKNSFGTYYLATAVFNDADFLATLPPAEFFSGLGELTKNGLILGGAPLADITRFLADLRRHPAVARDPARLVALVRSGIEAKRGLLAVDASEVCEAMLFEYGHTIGHALELTEHLPHGIAILYGMLFCSFASLRLGLITPAARRRHDRLIWDTLVLSPIAWRPTIARLAKIEQKALADNKRGIVVCAPNEITCVLLRDIGQPHRVDTSALSRIPLDLVKAWVHALILEAPVVRPAPTALSVAARGA